MNGKRIKNLRESFELESESEFRCGFGEVDNG